MGWPESVTYVLLVALGYALTRVVDLACDWQRRRWGQNAADPQPIESRLSATSRQRLMERRAVYARFRKSVTDAAVGAVNQGHGTYGMLYRIRDDYGDLLRNAPTPITQAADSIIRCVTLLVNLGSSDQRFAMYTRALHHFDNACAGDEGRVPVPPGPRRQEFSVDGAFGGSLPPDAPLRESLMQPKELEPRR